MSAFLKLRHILTKPVLWVLLYGALIVYGAYALIHIPVEVLPQFDYPQISVITRDNGATTRELESLIARPLEGELLSISNITSVRSTIGHGEVQTNIRFTNSTNPHQDLQAVYSAIDRARSQLPPSANPYAEIMGNAINEVADYSAQIPTSVAPVEVERAVKARLAPALRALPGVQRVEVYGTGDKALWVQPNLQAMEYDDVSIQGIITALRKHVVLGSGGYIHQGHQHVLVEVRNLPRKIEAINKISVRTRSGHIPLHDLARVIQAPVPIHNDVRLDGKNSVEITVLKQPDASTVPVTKAIQTVMHNSLRQLPQGVHWVRTYSQGYLVGLIEHDLGRNLLVGAALAIVVLLWILGAGRGIWILALSIPLSLLLAIGGLYAGGQSLNLLTLGALTVAVGLLADDGIIVLESIYRRWEAGENHWRGIRNGVGDVATPDITGTLTTISVFLPLFFVGGIAELFFLPFAISMATALAASLLISLTLIPLGLGFIKARARQQPTSAGRFLERVRGANLRLFDSVVRHPRWSLGSCIVLFILSIGGIAAVPVNFLSLPNEGVLLESFTLPPGTSLRQTEAVVDSITRAVRKNPDVANTYSRIGSSASTAYTEPSYAGEIQIKLKPTVNADNLNQIAKTILRESRHKAVQLAIDTPTIERIGESLSGLPQPFVIHLFGHNIQKMRNLSKKITARLRKEPGFTDIFNNDGYPITQLQIHGNNLSLTSKNMTPSGLYHQIDPLLNGKIISEIPDGNVPLDLYIRLAQSPDLNLPELRKVPIHTPGGWSPLGQLAHLKLVSTPNQIHHINGARALDILATPSGALLNAVSKAKKALQGLRIPAGYRVTFGGLYKQLLKTITEIGLASIAAIILIVAFILVQFEGLLVPSLLLLQIPLAFSGGLIALILSGVELNFTGLIGFLTLVGLSLNHGITLLYRALRNERSGMPIADAVKEAISVRFRPIILTTLTAVIGMAPTALGWGHGATPEQALAIIIMGGVIWNSVLVTNLIPGLYLYWRQKARKIA